jgi:protein-histidine N-methyltransferase
MLSFLRIACATGEELSRLCAGAAPATAALRPVSARNEEAALGALAAACEASLAAFETSIEDDDARLGDPALPENARRCMLVRRGEKRVLRHHLSLARAAEPLLRLQGEERARAARGLAASESGLGAYLADVAESLAPPRGDEAPTLRWKPPAA